MQTHIIKTKLLEGDAVRYSLNRAPSCFKVTMNDSEVTLNWPCPVESPFLHYRSAPSVVATVGILRSAGYLSLDAMFSKLLKKIFFPSTKKLSFYFLAREAIEAGAYFEGKAITLKRIDNDKLDTKIKARTEEVVCANTPPRSPTGNDINFCPITPETKPIAKSLLSKRKRLDNGGGRDNLKKSKHI